MMKTVFFWLIGYPEKSTVPIAQEMMQLLLELNDDPLQYKLICECITVQRVTFILDTNIYE